MSGNQGERIVRIDLNFDFTEAAADAKALAAKQVVVVGVRIDGDKWKTAKDADVDVGIVAEHVFRKRQSEAVLFEGVL